MKQVNLISPNNYWLSATSVLEVHTILFLLFVEIIEIIKIYKL